MRLIDADELKKCYTGTNGADNKASYTSIRAMIDNQPTVLELNDTMYNKVVSED